MEEEEIWLSFRASFSIHEDLSREYVEGLVSWLGKVGLINSEGSVAESEAAPLTAYRLFVLNSGDAFWCLDGEDADRGKISRRMFDEDEGWSRRIVRRFGHLWEPDVPEVDRVRVKPKCTGRCPCPGPIRGFIDRCGRGCGFVVHIAHTLQYLGEGREMPATESRVWRLPKERGTWRRSSTR